VQLAIKVRGEQQVLLVLKERQVRVDIEVLKVKRVIMENVALQG
jgi:hypothetical protein